jgi:hypothetical protein
LNINCGTISGIVATKPEWVEAGEFRILKFRLAHHPVRKTEQGFVTSSSFFNVQMGEKMGEQFNKTGKVGHHIFLEYKLVNRTWEQRDIKCSEIHLAAIMFDVIPSAKSRRENEQDQ